jgi:DNA-binding response OmpR family regulator
MATLMLVDDNRVLVDLTMLKLRRAMPEVTVVAAHNCEDARRIAGTLIPDIAVIDRVLPDGDGLSLSWELSERFAGVRIILLCSEAGRSDGGPPRFGFLSKPYELNDIVDEVRWALHENGKALTVPSTGETNRRPTSTFLADAARRQTLSRLAALLQGLHALGAELRADVPGRSLAGVADTHLDALIAAVLDITQLVQGRDDGH